jgi:hypothetical protein
MMHMNGSPLGILKKSLKFILFFDLSAFLCKKPVFREFSPAARGIGGE